MSDWRLQLYHRFPSLLRDVAATARGYQLRRWRYGPETEQLVATALERDSWTPEQWQTYRETRLAEVLHRASTRVPYYRQQWDKRRRQGDKASPEYLKNWPILEKAELRKQPRSFVADDCDTRQMYHEHTSGTTGAPLSLWWSRKVVRGWYALFEARSRKWYGVDRYNRWAILGGQLVIPYHQKKPPYWVWNKALNQLYMSTYHLSLQSVKYYLDALEHYNIDYILCYPSAAYAIATLARAQQLQSKPMKVVVTNAEPLYEYQRAIISEAFFTAVRETYGMAEIVAAASECECGLLHQWPEVGILETTEAGNFLGVGKSGDLIATGLLNEDMPLIRYRIGDRGMTSESTNACMCGRNLPILQQIEGRTDDMLYTVDGRVIGRLDPIFKSELPIQEAQIIQERLNFIRVKYVPDVGFSESTIASIASQIRNRVGDVHIEFECLNEVPRTKNGKFRAVICNLSPEERALRQ